VQHVYILHALAESQSILLLADVDSPEQLLSSLFSHAFDIFAGSPANTEMEISKSVEYHLKTLQCTVVEEVDLPTEVTDIIISQFLRVDFRKSSEQSSKTKKPDAQHQKQGTLLLKDYPPAYNMAKSICTGCEEKMTSQVTQYFNAIIVDAGVFSQTNAKDKPRRFPAADDSDDEQEGFADLRKAHRLLRELWRACPDILINVIPQIEAELSTDSVPLRQLATETIGDLVAGIGIAGLAPGTALDPAAYPLPSVDDPQVIPAAQNPLLTPASPKPFASIHRTVYQNFISRRNDRAPAVRAAWAQSAARIIFTVAGGIGLADNERDDLLYGLAQTLRDPDERVRIAAIRAMTLFDYQSTVSVLGADGGLSNTATVFATLAERFTDRKHNVREEAISLAAKLWGTASRDIEEGNKTVADVLGDFPNRLLNAYYTNDKHIHALLDQVMYESLLPLGFPPFKTQTSQSTSRKRKSRNAADSSQEDPVPDPDAVRARRILTLIRGLDTRSKQVFFGMQARQTQMGKAMTVLLKACEAYNGGVIDDPAEEEKVKKQLTNYIESISKHFPDSSKMSADLWKFADLHNRRDYQLIKFAMGPEHDYRTMQKAIKELNKRICEGPPSTQTIIESISPLIYRCALVVYNRSHVPAIMDASRTDEHGLAGAAHQVLREISARNPEVLKNHIQALCQELEEASPSATKFEEPSATDTLKACAHFARRYPSEVSKDRTFLSALTNFALYSKSPRAAKHAVSIVLTVADRKEMHAKQILTEALVDCEHTSPNFLSRLSAISQICLLAPTATNAETEAILKIMLADTLHKNTTPSSNEDANAWEDVLDDETEAKQIALKAMVNRCRSEPESLEDFDKIASPVLELLLQLVTNDGEIAPSNDTPAAQRNRLRLTAARFVLKLCSVKRRCDELVTPSMFISAALVVINPPNQVRSGFTNQLKKYLGQNKLSHRWCTILFLLAFEPDEALRSSTLTWLRSRVQFFERQQQQAHSADNKTYQNVMESIFGRLLSLMAHHPDYPDKEEESFDAELLDFSKYIIFYLVAVATEDNLSLIFHIAQRMKQTRDNVTGEDHISERLYVLSDLAQAIIRNYADMMPSHAKGVNLLQTWPGSVTLPRSLFRTLPSHDVAQKIAEKNHLPEDTALGLESLIKSYVKSVKGGKSTLRRPTYAVKKRKSGSIEPDDDDEGRRRMKKKKRTATPTLPVRKTPKVKRATGSAATSAQPSRKSIRTSTAVSYAEADSEDDDQEMEEIDRVAGSSPEGVGRVSKKAMQRDSSPAVPTTNGRDEDADMADAKEDPVNGVHVHEDADVDKGDDEKEEESDREPTPSPLKERQSPAPPKAKGTGKAKAKTPTKSKTAATERPARATRQTRAAKG
jgi:sister chromatid cohesion protein PDS5